MIRVDDGNLVYFKQPPQIEDTGLVWAVYSRLGGASEGAYASLNIGYHVGDDSERVTRNRSLIAQSLSFHSDHLVAAQQVHGSGVAIVDHSHRGRGAQSWDGALPQIDSMVTPAKETFLMITVADCAALTFYDPVKQVLGMAHCGWRGMVARLGQKTVEMMKQNFSCLPQDLVLLVSPSIGPCCYEVGDLVLAPLLEAFPNWQGLVRERGEKTHLDLWEMARRQAIESGLKAENVYVAGMCTACHTDLFYSHRAESGNTGRFAVVAGMR